MGDKKYYFLTNNEKHKTITIRSPESDTTVSNRNVYISHCMFSDDIQQ